MAKFKSLALDSALIEAALTELNSLETKIETMDASADQTTEGKMGIDKSNNQTCVYWLNFAKNNPDLFPARFDSEDFELKVDSLLKAQSVMDKMESIYAKLKNFRDNLAIDARFYTAKAITIATVTADSDSVLNTQIKSAPALKAERKSSKKAKNAEAIKPGETGNPNV